MNETTIPISALTKVNTCVLLVDGGDIVRWASDQLVTLCGRDLVGMDLDALEVASDRAVIGLALRCDDQTVLPLRGAWLTLKAEDGRVFVGSPAPSSIEELKGLDLSIESFSEDDSWLNCLIMAEEVKTTQRDAMERIDQLKTERRNLVEARDQMRDARRAAVNMLKDLEEARRRAEQATRSKSEFLANMSHEIRTPMTAILGFADVLLEEGRLEDAPPVRLDAAQTIKENGSHLLTIINDILDISKIEAGKLEIERIACSPVKVVTEVQSLMQVRASAKGLSLDIEFVDSIPETIYSDPTRLRQILLNLVGNAIKFTEMGGVRLISRFVGASDSQPKMQFDVVDTGIGLTADAAASVFDAFTQADTSTTRKFGGTGLGLTVSKRLAAMLGGDIVVVDSTPDAGACFRVTVATGEMADVKMIHGTITGAIEDAPTLPTSTDENQKLDCRILLAEDGPDNQRLISFILKKAGADVTVADNGRIAVTKAVVASKDGNPFDVIIMDMQMPVLDGYQATRQLRREGFDLPIIALTAHSMAGDREKCLQAGCDDYASKPIDRQALLKMIRGHVRRPSPVGAV